MNPEILPLHAAIEERHWWFVARRRMLKQLLTTVVPPGTGKRVLDLGCGTGGNLGALRSDYECAGLEIDQAAVEFARVQYPGIDVQRASVLTFDEWPDPRPVDACLMTDVIEHLDDDRGAMENAARILKPGGYLILTVPADPRLWSRHDEHHEHRRRYMPDDIRELTEGLPLTEVLIAGFNARLYWPIRIWRWIQTRVPALMNRGSTGDLHLPPPPVNRAFLWILEGEVRRMRRILKGVSAPYGRGVSLVALLMKQPHA